MRLCLLDLLSVLLPIAPHAELLIAFSYTIVAAEDERPWTIRFPVLLLRTAGPPDRHMHPARDYSISRKLGVGGKK
jgi:hypothetical protein